MEIGENVENKSQTQFHSVQSVPIFSSTSAEGNQNERRAGCDSKTSKNRRVSFASQTQLTQFLEPTDPFDTLGKFVLHLLTQVLLKEHHHNFGWRKRKVLTVGKPFSVIFHCLFLLFSYQFPSQVPKSF